MRKLVIAVDCDDVLIDSTEFIVSEYNFRYDTKATLADAYVSSNPQWGVERRLAMSRFHDIQKSKAFSDIMPRSDAREVVARLSQNHELHLVTARNREIESVTDKMLNVYFPDVFTRIDHVGEGGKGEICKKIAADVLIDDSAKHIRDAKACGTPYGVWFGSYPWQEHDIKFIEFDARCHDWFEVEKEIERIAAK